LCWVVGGGDSRGLGEDMPEFVHVPFKVRDGMGPGGVAVVGVEDGTANGFPEGAAVGGFGFIECSFAVDYRSEFDAVAFSAAESVRRL
jgi:hypothetical protein